jgi:hypothetical protein
MGKKFRGKLCAYCGTTPSTTEDHVFAREFFLPEERHNLPKAPACTKCNNEKSKLEQYFTSILPFGGRHDQAATNLQTRVPPRLGKNQKLHKELAATMSRAWLSENGGPFLPSLTIEIDGERLEELVSYIIRGLMWHHWQTYLGQQDFIAVMFLTGAGAAGFEQHIFALSPARRVSNDLGRGTVRYDGVQAAVPPELTIWRLSFYGGLLLSGGENKSAIPADTSAQWVAITGPASAKGLLDNLKGLQG